MQQPVTDFRIERYGSKGGSMKTILTALIVVFLLGSYAQADTYVKHKLHTDGYYYGGHVTPEKNREIDVWVGKEKTAFIHEHRSIIFNLKEKTFIFINLDDSTYVESTLPVDFSILVSEEYHARLQMFPTIGTVEATGEEREIDGMKCKGYKFHTWIPYEGTKYDESETIAWIAADTPFNVEAFTEVNAQRLKLHNYVTIFSKK